MAFEDNFPETGPNSTSTMLALLNELAFTFPDAIVKKPNFRDMNPARLGTTHYCELLGTNSATFTKLRKIFASRGCTDITRGKYFGSTEIILTVFDPISGKIELTLKTKTSQKVKRTEINCRSSWTVAESVKYGPSEYSLNFTH